MLETAFVGFFLALSFNVINGVLEGLFGQKALIAVSLISSVVIVFSVFILGIDKSVNQMPGFAFWIGFISGAILTLPVEDKIVQDLQ